MTRRNNGQTTELSLHHRHGTALAVTIRGHLRMLNESSDLPHQFRHTNLRANTQKANPLLKAKFNHQRSC